MNNLDITKLNIQELKALAYDELAKVEQSQNNIRLLNVEINERNKLQSTGEAKAGLGQNSK